MSEKRNGINLEYISSLKIVIPDKLRVRRDEIN